MIRAGVIRSEIWSTNCDARPDLYARNASSCRHQGCHRQSDPRAGLRRCLHGRRRDRSRLAGGSGNRQAVAFVIALVALLTALFLIIDIISAFAG
jgi:hypothetical protein